MKCSCCKEEKKINGAMRIDGVLKPVCNDCLTLRIRKDKLI